jgi:hypothetical protein
MNGKLKLGDYFKIDNIKNFVEGKWNKFKGYSTFLRLEQHLREQAIYRAILCRECYVNEICLLCGCQTPDMFYAPAKECPDDKWKTMLSKDQWEEFKEINEIDGNTLTDFNIDDLLYDELEGMPEWFRRQIMENEAVKKSKDKL